VDAFKDAYHIFTVLLSQKKTFQGTEIEVLTNRCTNCRFLCSTACGWCRGKRTEKSAYRVLAANFT